MKYSEMTPEDLYNYGKYNLFTIAYPGSYMIPEAMDFLYYSKELALRAPNEAKTLIDMVLANAVPDDIPKSTLDLDIAKPAGKFWVAAGIAAILNDPVYTEKIISQLPERIDKLAQTISQLPERVAKYTPQYQYLALYYDKSPEMKDYFKTIFKPDIEFLRTTMAYFTVARYHWLGISQTESARELLKLWQLDETRLFLICIEQDCNWSSLQEHADIDIFAQAVQKKPKEAVKLLETLKESTELMPKFHASAKNYWIPSWANFLYRYCNLGDEVLEAALKGDTNKKGITGKKTETLCQELKNAKNKAFALPSALDLSEGKNIKKHLYALFSSDRELNAADVKNYAGSNLLWSSFEDGRLKEVFAIDKNSCRLFYKNGNLADMGAYVVKDGVYKIFNPADLDGTESAGTILKELSKALKAAGISTLINQLAGSYQDFSDDELWNSKIIRWQGNVTSQQTIIVTAGKHFLIKGHDSNGSYNCYHYVNPIDGRGSVINFNRIWSGPEYACVLRTIYHAEFYKLPPNGFTYSEAVPESMKTMPKDTSGRLKYYIMNVFDSLAKDKASKDQPIIPKEK